MCLLRTRPRRGAGGGTCRAPTPRRGSGAGSATTAPSRAGRSPRSRSGTRFAAAARSAIAPTVAEAVERSDEDGLVLGPDRSERAEYPLVEADPEVLGVDARRPEPLDEMRERGEDHVVHRAGARRVGPRSRSGRRRAFRAGAARASSRRRGRAGSAGRRRRARTRRPARAAWTPGRSRLARARAPTPAAAAHSRRRPRAPCGRVGRGSASRRPRCRRTCSINERHCSSYPRAASPGFRA